MLKLIDSLSKSDRSIASCRAQLASEWFAITVSSGARRMLTAFKGGAGPEVAFETLFDTASLPE